MTTSQFATAVNKIVNGMLDRFFETYQQDFDQLYDHLDVMAGWPWGKSPTAAGELNTIASLLRTERQRQQMSLFEIEAATGISRSSLSLIERQRNGNPSIEPLERIAAALGMKVVVALVERDDQNEETAVENEKTTDQNEPTSLES